MRLTEHHTQACPAGREETDGSPAPDGANTAVLLDPEAIERLRQLDPGGQQGVLMRVLQAYETSLVRYLDDIASVVAAGDVERLKRSAHTLKSSSAAVGALEFSRICAEVEQLAAKAGSLPGPGAVEAMVHEGRRVLAAVRTMLAG